MSFESGRGSGHMLTENQIANVIVNANAPVVGLGAEHVKLTGEASTLVDALARFGSETAEKTYAGGLKSSETVAKAIQRAGLRAIEAAGEGADLSAVRRHSEERAVASARKGAAKRTLTVAGLRAVRAFSAGALIID